MGYMATQCDHVIDARRPDIVVVEKENNKAIILDKLHPGITECMERKVTRLRNNYQDLKREIERL